MLCSWRMWSSKLTALLSNWERSRPQVKHVFFKISSFLLLLAPRIGEHVDNDTENEIKDDNDDHEE
jgi:hypothetical protein